MKSIAKSSSFTGDNPGRTYTDRTAKVKNGLFGRNVVKTTTDVSSYKPRVAGGPAFYQGTTTSKVKKVYKDGELVKMKTKYSKS